MVSRVRYHLSMSALRQRKGKNEPHGCAGEKEIEERNVRGEAELKKIGREKTHQHTSIQ